MINVKVLPWRGKEELQSFFFEVGGKVVSCSKYSAPCRKDLWPDVACTVFLSVLK